MPVASMRFAPVTRNLTKLLDIRSLRLLDTFAQYNPSPLSIQQFVDFGRNATEAESFNFLRKEIPIRLSNIMKEINLLPSTLLQMPSVMLLQVTRFRTINILNIQLVNSDSLKPQAILGKLPKIPDQFPVKINPTLLLFVERTTIESSLRNLKALSVCESHKAVLPHHFRELFSSHFYLVFFPSCSDLSSSQSYVT